MAGFCGLFAAVGRCPGEWILRGGWSKHFQPFEEESVSGVTSAL